MISPGYVGRFLRDLQSSKMFAARTNKDNARGSSDIEITVKVRLHTV